jgi:hypothetical protein
VSHSATWAISSEHAARTLLSQRSRTSRPRWAATVRILELARPEKAARARRDTYWPRGFLVDFDNFQRVLNRPGGFRDPGEPEEYCRGFQVFDKELTGFIGVGQFRYILTNLGEKMSDEEVDELLKAVDTSSGELNYMGELLFDLFSGDRSTDDAADMVKTILAN